MINETNQHIKGTDEKDLFALWGFSRLISSLLKDMTEEEILEIRKMLNDILRTS